MRNDDHYLAFWLVSISGRQPENILCLTKTGNRIKLIDFGLARRFDPSKKLQVLFGTPEFVAPEVVNFDQIGFGTDLWSVGIICYVL
jgi:myosin-light-chain kinase